jgi:hypothetical protein
MTADGSKKPSFVTKLLAFGIVAVAILVILRIVVNAISDASLFIALGLIALGMGVVWAVRQLR